MSKTIFFEELIFLDISSKTSNELFLMISPILLKGGWVKPSFQSAIISREEVFPTGLQTEPVSVAIPHTDAEHVEKSFVAFLRIKDDIPFKHMGIPDKKVQAKFVFILGISEPKNQVVILSNLIDAFSNEDVMTELIKTTDKKRLLFLLNKLIKKQ